MADDVNLKTLALPGEDSKDKDFEQMVRIIVVINESVVRFFQKTKLIEIH